MKEYSLDTNEGWNALQRGCNDAKHSIDVMEYMVRDDSRGRDFISLLIDKAKEGVKIRLMMDSLGSRQMLNHALTDALIDAGGEVCFESAFRFGKKHIAKPFFPNNHCKMCIIDKSVWYIGGLCFADFMEGWRETLVRIEQDSIEAPQAHFDALWDYLCEKKALHIRHIEQGDTHYLLQCPPIDRMDIYEVFMQRAQSVTQHIQIMSPYFFPPEPVYDVLHKAAKKGVQVTLLHPEKTDSTYCDMLHRYMLRSYEKDHIDVRFYTPRKSHAKYCIIDDWATIGSCNFDKISLKHNHEANIAFCNADDVNALKVQFEQDMRESREATCDDWELLPFRHKIMAYMARVAYALL